MVIKEGPRRGAKEFLADQTRHRGETFSQGIDRRREDVVAINIEALFLTL